MSFGKLPLRLLAVASAVVPLAAIGLFAPSAGAAITTCSGTGGTFAGGAGTTADPYLISNQAQLETIGKLNDPGDPASPASYLSCAFKLTNDITLSGSWKPIADGLYGRSFTGEFNGDGHTISGLSILSVSTYFTGLFGNTNGTVENLFLKGEISDPTASNAGGLVGQANSGTLIRNVHADVDVSGDSVLGGLVGWGPEVRIENSSSSGDVTRIGTGTFGRLGGLIGWAMGRNGYTPDYTSITDSYSTGSVTGAAGTPAIGGLVGHIDSSDDLRIVRSYAAGPIAGGTSSPGTSGGLVAPLSSGSFTDLTVTGSFWDTETTGKSTSANGLGTGKTTAEMKSFSTFNTALWNITDGWSDSTVWGICDGSTYPFLSTQYSSTPCEFDLSVSKTGAGAGTVTSSPSGIDCGSDCVQTYNRDTQVTLTATAASGSSFGGWSGSGCTGTGTCEVTMSEARAVEAAFAADPPSPDPPTPTGEPRLRVSMGGADRVRAGKAFKLGVQLRNKGTEPARDLNSCLALPKALLLVKAKGAKVSGQSICWTRSSLGENKTASYKATVRSSSTSKGSLVARATVSASNASGGSVSSGGSEEIRIVKPKPRPRPQPPTG